ncbi:MAG: hypothetical protein GC205_11880 [Bacteroidetes bacterium]|nr:hypothetical protein [Bacteroidota bacterium]
MQTHHIGAFYRFIPVAAPAALKEHLLHLGQVHSIMGTIIVSGEGLNGTVAGSEAGLPAFLQGLEQYLGISDLVVKRSTAALPPFQRFKIKIKSEIVTLRAGEVSPLERTGVYVPPSEWNQLIQQEDVLLIDTRNDFEVQLGQFDGAVNPGIAAFRDFPAYVAEQMDPERHRRVAMYCTGGIRCEKASAYLLQHGYEEVYQLDGGILNYLEKVEPEESLWKGDCFVFDDRIAVTPTLEPSQKGHPPRPGRDW